MNLEHTVHQHAFQYYSSIWWGILKNTNNLKYIFHGKNHPPLQVNVVRKVSDFWQQNLARFNIDKGGKGKNSDFKKLSHFLNLLDFQLLSKQIFLQYVIFPGDFFAVRNTFWYSLTSFGFVKFRLWIFVCGEKYLLVFLEVTQIQHHLYYAFKNVGFMEVKL